MTNDQVIPIPGAFQIVYNDILDSSPLPRPETAYSATLAILSMVIGRTTSLNEIMPTVRQFVIMPSGFGKNIIERSIASILSGVGLKGQIGSSHITSETSFLDEMSVRHACPEMISICDEAQKLIKGLKSHNVEECLNAVATKKWGDPLQSKRVISYQGIKSKQNIGEGVYSPFFSFIGMTTPQGFYSTVPDDIKDSGFWNRHLFWLTDEWVNLKILNKKTTFATSIEQCKRFEKTCNIKIRSDYINGTKTPTHDFNLDKYHNFLKFSVNGQGYLQKKLDKINDLRKKRHEEGLNPKQEWERLFERLMGMLVIYHCSLYPEDFDEKEISDEEIYQMSEIDQVMFIKSTEQIITWKENSRKRENKAEVKRRVCAYCKRNGSFDNSWRFKISDISNGVTFKRKRLGKKLIMGLVKEKFLNLDSELVSLNTTNDEVREILADLI